MGNGNPLELPFAQRVALARQQMMQPSGIRATAPQTPAPTFEGMGLPQGYRSPEGLGSVDPQLDAALLQEAVGTGGLGIGRLPEEALEAPLSETEQALGIESQIVPGMTPHLPLQTEAPSVPFLERTKAMNLSMTPEGMAEHFRQLGFDAQTSDPDIYSERHHPMLTEMTSGQGYNITIREPTTGEYHVLDPESFELKDLSDGASDIIITLGSIFGANAAARVARESAKLVAQKAAKEASESAVKHVFMKGGKQVGEELVADPMLARAAQAAAVKAARPTTHPGARVGGAIFGHRGGFGPLSGTLAPEGIRQGIAASMAGTEPGQIPEEGLGPRAGRVIEEVLASGIGELADPFESIRHAVGRKGRQQIDKWLKAHARGASPEELSQMDLPKDALGAGRADWTSGSPRFTDPEVAKDPTGKEGGEGEDPLEFSTGEKGGGDGGGGGRQRGPAPEDTEGEREYLFQVRGEERGGEAQRNPLRTQTGETGYRGEYSRRNRLEGQSANRRAWENEYSAANEGKVLDAEEHEIRGSTSDSLTEGIAPDRTVTEYRRTKTGATTDEDYDALRRITAKYNDAEGRPTVDDLDSLGQARRVLDDPQYGLAEEIRAGRIDALDELGDRRSNESIIVRSLRAPGDAEDLTGNIWKLVDAEAGSTGTHVVGPDPLFVSKAHIDAVLDGQDGAAAKEALAKMDWDDVLNEVDNWDRGKDGVPHGLADQVDAFKKAGLEWNKLEGDSDAEKAIRWVAKQKDAVAPEVGFKKTLKDGYVRVWGKFSESGGVMRNRWHDIPLDGIEGVGREMTRGATEGRPQSTVGRVQEMFDQVRGRAEEAEADISTTKAEGRAKETELAEEGPEISQAKDTFTARGKGKLTISEITAKSKRIKELKKQLGVLQKKSKRTRAQEARVEKLKKQIADAEVAAKEEKAARAERLKDLEKRHPRKERKKSEHLHRDEREARPRSQEEREAEAGSGNQQAKFRDILNQTGGKKSNIITRAVNYAISKAKSLDTVESEAGGEVLFPRTAAKTLAKAVETRLKTPDEEAWGPALIPEHTSIQKYKPKGNLPSFERALEMLGGEHNPLFGRVDAGSKHYKEIRALAQRSTSDAPPLDPQAGFYRTAGIDAIEEVMRTGKLPKDWDYSTWNPKLQPEATPKWVYDHVTRTIFNKLDTGKYDIDAILGTTTTSKQRGADHAGDNFARLRAHIEDIVIAHRTTDQALIIGLVKKMNEDFFDVNYKPGKLAEGAPGSGLFEDVRGTSGIKSWSDGGSKPAIRDELRGPDDPGGRSKEEIDRLLYGDDQDEDDFGFLGYIRGAGLDPADPTARRPVVIDIHTGRQVDEEGVLRAAWKLGRHNPTWGDEHSALLHMIRTGEGPDHWDPDMSWKWYKKDENGKWDEVDPRNTDGAVKAAEMERIIHAERLEGISAEEMNQAWNNLPARMVELDQKLDVDAIKDLPELKNRLKWLGYTDDKVAAFTPEDAWVRANYGIEAGSKLDTDYKSGGKPEGEGGGRGDGDGDGKKKKKKKKTKTESEKRDEETKSAVKEATARFDEDPENNASDYFEAELKRALYKPVWDKSDTRQPGEALSRVYSAIDNMRGDEPTPKVTKKTALRVIREYWDDSTDKPFNYGDPDSEIVFREVDVKQPLQSFINKIEKDWPPEGGGGGDWPWDDIPDPSTDFDGFRKRVDLLMSGDEDEAKRAKEALRRARESAANADTLARIDDTEFGAWSGGMATGEIQSGVEIIPTYIHTRHLEKTEKKGLWSRAFEKWRERLDKSRLVRRKKTKTSGHVLLVDTDNEAVPQEMVAEIIHHLDTKTTEIYTHGRKDAGRYGEFVGHLHKDAATLSGLKEGDLIYAINDKPIESGGDAPAFDTAYAKGEDMKVHYVRDGKKQVTKSFKPFLTRRGVKARSTAQRYFHKMRVQERKTLATALKTVEGFRPGKDSGSVVIGRYSGADPTGELYFARVTVPIGGRVQSAGKASMLVSDPIRVHPHTIDPNLGAPTHPAVQGVQELIFEPRPDPLYPNDPSKKNLYVTNDIPVTPQNLSREGLVNYAKTGGKTLVGRTPGPKGSGTIVVSEPITNLKGLSITQVLEILDSPTTQLALPQEIRTLRSLDLENIRAVNDAMYQKYRADVEDPYEPYMALKQDIIGDIDEADPNYKQKEYEFLKVKALLEVSYAGGQRSGEVGKLGLDKAWSGQAKRKGKQTPAIKAVMSEVDGRWTFNDEALRNSRTLRAVQEYINARYEQEPDSFGPSTYTITVDGKEVRKTNIPAFTKKDEGQYDLRLTSKEILKITRRARGVDSPKVEADKIDTRSYRHSKATYLVQLGAHPKKATAVLGHKDPKSHEHYKHVREGVLSQEGEYPISQELPEYVVTRASRMAREGGGEIDGSIVMNYEEKALLVRGITSREGGFGEAGGAYEYGTPRMPETSRLRFNAYVQVGLGTGMSSHELRNLTVGAFKQLAKIYSEAHGGEIHPAELAVREYLLLKKHPGDWDGNPKKHLFVNHGGKASGKVPSQQVFQTQLKTWGALIFGEDHRLAKLHPHSLRHTFTTHLIDQSHKVKKVDEFFEGKPKKKTASEETADTDAPSMADLDKQEAELQAQIAKLQGDKGPSVGGTGLGIAALATGLDIITGSGGEVAEGVAQAGIMMFPGMESFGKLIKKVLRIKDPVEKAAELEALLKKVQAEKVELQKVQAEAKEPKVAEAKEAEPSPAAKAMAKEKKTLAESVGKWEESLKEKKAAKGKKKIPKLKEEPKPEKPEGKQLKFSELKEKRSAKPAPKSRAKSKDEEEPFEHWSRDEGPDPNKLASLSEKELMDMKADKEAQVARLEERAATSSSFWRDAFGGKTLEAITRDYRNREIGVIEDVLRERGAKAPKPAAELDAKTSLKEMTKLFRERHNVFDPEVDKPKGSVQNIAAQMMQRTAQMEGEVGEFLVDNVAVVRWSVGVNDQFVVNQIRSLVKGEGHGKAVYRKIIEAADELGVTLTGTAKAFGEEKGLSQGDLVKWYLRMGYDYAPGHKGLGVVDLIRKPGAKKRSAAAVEKLVKAKPAAEVAEVDPKLTWDDHGTNQITPDQARAATQRSLETGAINKDLASDLNDIVDEAVEAGTLKKGGFLKKKFRNEIDKLIAEDAIFRSAMDPERPSGRPVELAPDPNVKPAKEVKAILVKAHGEGFIPDHAYKQLSDAIDPDNWNTKTSKLVQLGIERELIDARIKLTDAPRETRKLREERDGIIARINEIKTGAGGPGEGGIGRKMLDIIGAVGALFGAKALGLDDIVAAEGLSLLATGMFFNKKEAGRALLKFLKEAGVSITEDSKGVLKKLAQGKTGKLTRGKVIRVLESIGMKVDAAQEMVNQSDRPFREGRSPIAQIRAMEAKQAEIEKLIGREGRAEFDNLPVEDKITNLNSRIRRADDKKGIEAGTITKAAMNLRHEAPSLGVSKKRRVIIRALEESHDRLQSVLREVGGTFSDHPKLRNMNTALQRRIAVHKRVLADDFGMRITEKGQAKLLDLDLRINRKDELVANRDVLEPLPTAESQAKKIKALLSEEEILAVDDLQSRLSDIRVVKSIEGRYEKALIRAGEGEGGVIYYRLSDKPVAGVPDDEIADTGAWYKIERDSIYKVLNNTNKDYESMTLLEDLVLGRTAFEPGKMDELIATLHYVGRGDQGGEVPISQRVGGRERPAAYYDADERNRAIPGGREVKLLRLDVGARHTEAGAYASTRKVHGGTEVQGLYKAHGNVSPYDERQQQYVFNQEFYRFGPDPDNPGAEYSWYIASDEAKRSVAKGYVPDPRFRLMPNTMPSSLVLEGRLIDAADAGPFGATISPAPASARAPWSMSYADFKEIADIKPPRKGLVEVKYEGFTHEVPVDKGVPESDIPYVVWNRLMDPTYRRASGLEYKIKPASSKLGSAKEISNLSPEEAIEQAKRDLLGSLEASGKVPELPDSGRLIGGTGHTKTREAGHALPDPRGRHELLMHFAPEKLSDKDAALGLKDKSYYLQYEGRGLHSSAARRDMLEGSDWSLLGVEDPGIKGIETLDDFAKQVLVADGLLKNDLSLSKDGKEFLVKWQVQQEAHDTFMNAAMDIINDPTVINATVAKKVLTELHVNKRSPLDVRPELVKHLEKQGVPVASYTPGHISKADIAAVRSSPGWVAAGKVIKQDGISRQGASITLRLPAIEDTKRPNVEFQWSEGANNWVVANSKGGHGYDIGTTVNDIYDDLAGKANKAITKEGREDFRVGPKLYEKMKPFRELMENPDIVPESRLGGHYERTPVSPPVKSELTPETPVDENSYMVITKYQDGYHEFAKFTSYRLASDYVNSPAMSPMTHTHDGKNFNFLSVIERGRRGLKFEDFQEAADISDLMKGMAGMTKYRARALGIQAKIGLNEFRLNQMNSAYFKLQKMLKDKADYMVPDWRVTKLGTETKLDVWVGDENVGFQRKPGTPKKTEVEPQIATGSLIGKKIAKEIKRWDNTGTGWREATGRKEVEDELGSILKKMKELYEENNKLLAEKEDTAAKVTANWPEDRIKRSREAAAERKAQGPSGTTDEILTSPKTREVGDTVKTGIIGIGLAYMAHKLGMDAADLSGETLEAMIAMVGVPGGLTASLKKLGKGIPNLFNKAGERIKALIPEQQSRLKELGMHAFEAAQGKTRRLSGQRRGIDRSAAVSQVAGAKILKIIKANLGDEAARSVKETFRLGEAGGVRGRITPALPERGAATDPYIDPRRSVPEGDTTRPRDIALSGHKRSGEAIKMVLASGDKVELTTRKGAPYAANQEELDMFVREIQDALGDDFVVTQAKWKGEKVEGADPTLEGFYTARGDASVVIHRGLIISPKEGRPPLFTAADVDAAIGSKHAAPRLEAWQKVDAVYRIEAEEIMDSLDEPARMKFLEWLVEEDGGQTYLRGRHEGGTMRKFGEDLWDLTRKYARGDDIPWSKGADDKILRIPDGSEITTTSRANMLQTIDDLKDPSKPGELPDVEYTKLTEKSIEKLENLSKEDIKAIKAVRQDIGLKGLGGDAQNVSPELREVADRVLSMPGMVNTPAAQRLVIATKRLADPIGTMPREGREAQEGLWWSNNESKRKAYTKELLKEVEEALKEYLKKPEAGPFATALRKAGEKLKGLGSGAFSGGPIRAYWTYRMLRSFWGGNMFSSGIARSLWQVRRFKFASRILGDVVEDLAAEPTRANARRIFSSEPKVLELLPDHIKKELGLPPFEKEYKAKHRTALLSQNALGWLTQSTGVEFPDAPAGVLVDAADEGSVEGAKGFIGRLTGARAGRVAPRLGITRLRDRPMIKEEISRWQDAQRRKDKKEEEERKKKKKRRLPKKLQRS